MVLLVTTPTKAREILHQALSGYNTRDGIHPADLLRFLEELEKAVEAMYNIALNHPTPASGGQYSALGIPFKMIMVD